MAARKCFIVLLAVLALSLALPTASRAQQPLKVGVILPMSGPFASSIGQQVYLGAKLYVAQHGDVVAGRKVELILRDDASVPESSWNILIDGGLSVFA